MRLGQSIRANLNGWSLSSGRLAAFFKRTPHYLDHLLWFLILLSWLPIISGYVGLIDNFIPGRWGPVTDPVTNQLYWLAKPITPVFGVIAVAILLLSIGLRRLILAICAIAPIIASVLGSEGPLQTYNTAYYLSIAYIIAFVASLVLFAWYGRLRSVPTFLFVAICFWDFIVESIASLGAAIQNLFDEAVSSTSVENWTVVHRLLAEHAFSLPDVLIALVCLMFVRFLVLLWQQNRAFAKKLFALDRKYLLKTYFWPAFKLWSPMLLAFVFFGLYLYPNISAYISLRVANEITADLTTRGAERGYFPKPICAESMEEAVRCLIEYNRIAYQADAKQAVDEIQWATVKTSEDLKNVVYPTLETRIFPTRLPGTSTSGCGRMSIPCHAKNGVKSVANSAYRRLRDPPLAGTKRTIEDIHARVGNDSAQLAAESKAMLAKEIDRLAEQSNFAFTKALYANRMFSLVMLILSIMVLVKTYFIVLARYIFDTDNRNRFHAAIFDQGGPIEAEVEIERQPYKLKKSSGRNYYLANDLNLPHGLPLFWIPRPGMAIAHRLLARRYALGYVDVADGKENFVSIELPNTHDLIRWQIPKDEAVIFRFKDLVGYSTNLRIATHISFSLQALLFGRVVFRLATGPGVLLLRSLKTPIVGAGSDAGSPARQSRDAGTLISWHTTTPFESHSRLNFQGVFVRGYNLEKQAKGKVVYIFDGGNTARLGIGRWIRTFLSPI